MTAGIMTWARILVFGLILAGADALDPHTAAAANPAVHTNQDFIKELSRKSTLRIADVPSVFLYVLASLPDRVRVYPTENYYYFGFHHNGMDYSGNIRLGATMRDQGKIDFTYFPAFTGWRRDQAYKFKTFSAKDGVQVEKLRDLVYKVAFKDKSVVFELNDLSGVKPPKTLMNGDETYIGPVFDESGMQFFLLYNSRLKLFHYILNETRTVPDEIYVSKISRRILIGRRTGFAFYQDKNKDRKILIGVWSANSSVNNYLDGPFDQLPDNFIKGDILKNALIDAVPELKGRIDRYGFWKDSENRYLIGPYLYYTDVGELRMFDDCANDKEMRGQFYYRCFVVEETDPAGGGGGGGGGKDQPK